MHSPVKVAILLVDDRRENLQALAALLEQVDGLELVLANSGEEALRLLLKREFGLVLMDVQMPGMGGIEAATLMRANQKTRHVPIIFVTALKDSSDFEFRGYQSGAVDYLVKPIEPLILHAKVQVFAQLFRQRQAIAEYERYVSQMGSVIASYKGRRGTQGHELRLLLVDDRPENLVALEALLAELEGVVLVKAQSGPEALHAVLQSEFAAILLDVQMPGMDGFETAELIRANPKSSTVPIIFVTAGMKGREAQFKGYDKGAVDYLIKPLEPAILTSKMRVFCDLYRQRLALELQGDYLENVVAERTEALKQNRDKLALAMRAAHLGIWDWNLVTQELVWDEHMYALCGVRPGQLGDAHQTWLATTHPDDRALCELAKLRAVRNEQVYDIEFRVCWPDGTVRTIKADGQVVWDDQGAPLRMTGVHRDITERKRAEDKLRTLNEELEARVEQRTQELRRAMEKIAESEKLASLAGIVVGVAHELSTPIGNIVMTASTLGDRVAGLDDDAQQGKLTKSGLSQTLHEWEQGNGLILRNAQRACELIESFKKVAVDQTSQNRRVFDLRTLANVVLNELSTTLRENQAGWELLIPAGIEMNSFPGDLEQIFAHLIMNSIHHGFEQRGSGQIVIDALVRDSMVEIRYLDDGAGIAPELKRKVFDPFYTTKLGYGGSGLGLFVVHNLVRGVLKGEIELDSDLGKGVTITLTVPLTTP